MTRAIDLLKNKFGVSQLYKYDIKDSEDNIVFTVYWHPLTIAEREMIQKKSGTEDTNDFALQLMIEKAIDKEGNRLFADGDKASLRREEKLQQVFFRKYSYQCFRQVQIRRLKGQKPI